MMSVKRYGLHMCGTLAEKADGEYVKASDYDTLKLLFDVAIGHRDHLIEERDLLLAVKDAWEWDGTDRAMKEAIDAWKRQQEGGGDEH
jgi:hypothetical protein